MTKTLEQTLAETRAYSTDEERTVLALEAIADQLRLLVEVLRPTGDQGAAAGAEENEGGSLASRTL